MELAELSREWHAELYEWANKDSCLPNISVMYKDSKVYEKADDFLKSRFEKCKTIPGTRELHCVEPEKNYSLKVDMFFLPKLQNCELCET